MKSSTEVLIRIAIALGFSQLAAAEGSREADSAASSYSAETAGGCVYSLELYEAGQSSMGLGINGPVNCRATLQEELSAIAALLDQIRRDDHPIDGFRMFNLGRIRPAEWHERIADCYIDRFGADERVFQDAATILETCPFFPELTQLFADKGVRIRLSEIEKIEWVDLQLLATGDPSGFGEVWGNMHRNNKGRVPIGARAFFELDSADRVYSHYAMYPPQDKALLEFWTRVAAENGSAGYMLAYAGQLHRQGGYVRCRRALYWLHRATLAQPATAADAEY